MEGNPLSVQNPQYKSSGFLPKFAIAKVFTFLEIAEEPRSHIEPPKYPTLFRLNL